MSKVIMFSRYFQKGHPREGQPTYFVEKLWTATLSAIPQRYNTDLIVEQIQNYLTNIYLPKYHTIRKGKRFKAGDKFSARVWSEKPYCSQQIEVAEDIEVKQVFDFKMLLDGAIFIDGKQMCDKEKLVVLAQNDGLSYEDLLHWFRPPNKKAKEFDGQIICWSSNVKYE